MLNIQQTIIMENIKEFIEYCKSFYFGENAIYPLRNASHIDFVHACNLVARRTDIEFAGDSFDRERVRDILESVGFKEAK